MIQDSPIKKGIYKHFKGNLYRVLGEGLNTETMELYVVYEPLYTNEYNLFVRPKSMFTELLSDGTPRFQFIREEYDN